MKPGLFFSCMGLLLSSLFLGRNKDFKKSRLLLQTDLLSWNYSLPKDAPVARPQTKS